MSKIVTFAIRRTLEGMRDPIFSVENPSWANHIEDLGYILNMCSGIADTDEKKVLYALRMVDDGILIAMVRRIAKGRIGDNLTAWVHVPTEFIMRKNYLRIVIGIIRNEFLSLYSPDEDKVRIASQKINEAIDFEITENYLSQTELGKITRENSIDQQAYLLVHDQDLQDWPELFIGAFGGTVEPSYVLLLNVDNGIYPAANVSMIDAKSLHKEPKIIAPPDYRTQKPRSNKKHEFDVWYKLLIAVLLAALIVVLLMVSQLPKFGSIDVNNQYDYDMLDNDSSLTETDWSDYYDYYLDDAPAFIYLDSAHIWRRSEMEKIDYLKGLFDAIDSLAINKLSDVEFQDKYLFSDRFASEVKPIGDFFSDDIVVKTISKTDYLDRLRQQFHRLSPDGETLNIDSLKILFDDLKAKVITRCNQSNIEENCENDSILK